MPLHERTREFLKFLRANPGTRTAIAAHPDRTILYAGEFFRPMWREIEELKRSTPEYQDKQMLPDVLKNITTGDTRFPTLLAWAKDLDSIDPWRDNGFVAWRALSGLFAANARGKVSFAIGSGVTRGKVFAATEIPVLLRNNQIDPVSRDLVEFYDRCIRTGQAEVNVGFISG